MNRPPLAGLRILMVVDGKYPATGGAEMQARTLSAALAARGHHVHVLVPRLDRTLPVHDRVDGLTVERLDYPRIKGLGAILLNLKFTVWLFRHRSKFDAMHIHMMHNLAGAAGWIAPWLPMRTVVKVSGAAEFQGGILDPSKRRKPVHRVLVAGARRLGAFQCISQRTRHIMDEAGFAPARLHLVPNAVDTTKFQPTPESAPPRVVFVGRHVAVKAIDVLLRAWAQRPRRGEARLVIAGDGPERPALMALAAELGVTDSVEFPGLVQDVPNLLAGAALYVQASHQEGLPNAVLEAMAAGLPVVATRVSGHEDVVDHDKTGLLVPPDAPQQLADAMQKLLDNPALRKQMGEAGRQVIESNYSLLAVTDRLLHLYGGPAEQDIPFTGAFEKSS